MTKSPTSLVVPILMLIAAMVAIQTGASLAKQLFPVLGAHGTATLRLCFAATILAFICKPWRLLARKTPIRPIILYGVAMGSMNLLIYLALTHIPLGVAVALEFTGPLGVAVCTSRRPVDFLWVACAVAGVLLLLPDAQGQEAMHLQGFFYALGAGFCWAMYIVFGQKAGQSASSGAVTSAGMVIAALLVTPTGVTYRGDELLQLAYWPQALGVAILSSALPYWLEMNALKALPTRTFGILMSMEPAVAAFSGLIILGEWLSEMQWGGIACIMLASAGAVLSVRRLRVPPGLPN